MLLRDESLEKYYAERIGMSIDRLVAVRWQILDVSKAGHVVARRRLAFPSRRVTLFPARVVLLASDNAHVS